jgi:hypothetical protein
MDGGVGAWQPGFAGIRRSVSGTSNFRASRDELRLFLLPRVSEAGEWDQRQDSKGECRDPMLEVERVNG